MANTKPVVVKTPSGLIEEVDRVADIEDKNEFIKEAMRLYLRERRKIQAMENMKNGYREMSRINRKLSEDGFSQDASDFFSYEMNLSGCEGF